MSQTVTPIGEHRLEHRLDGATAAATEMLAALGVPSTRTTSRTPRAAWCTPTPSCSARPVRDDHLPQPSSSTTARARAPDIPARSLC